MNDLQRALLDLDREDHPAEHMIEVYQRILAIREAELLELKGPCPNCRLHFAHRGPCDR